MSSLIGALIIVLQCLSSVCKASISCFWLRMRGLSCKVFRSHLSKEARIGSWFFSTCKKRARNTLIPKQPMKKSSGETKAEPHEEGRGYSVAFLGHVASNSVADLRQRFWRDLVHDSLILRITQRLYLQQKRLWNDQD